MLSGRLLQPVIDDKKNNYSDIFKEEKKKKKKNNLKPRICFKKILWMLYF